MTPQQPAEYTLTTSGFDAYLEPDEVISFGPRGSDDLDAVWVGTAADLYHALLKSTT